MATLIGCLSRLDETEFIETAIRCLAAQATWQDRAKKK